MIYTFFGFRRFKKLYGDYNIFDEDMKLWTLALSLATAWSIIAGLIFCIMYLP